MNFKSGKKFAAFLFAALLFIAVISGGCGGSSSSIINSGNGTVTDIDALVNGAWRIDTSYENTVSVDINGTEVNLAIRDFAFFIKSADMEGSETIYLEAIAILSSDKVLLPLIMDIRSFDVSFVDNNLWALSAGNSSMFMHIDDNSSQPLLNVYGKTSFNGVETYLDVTFSKLETDSAPEDNERINNFLNGTWQSPADKQTGGGFVYTSIRLDVPELPELPENNNMPALEGMMPINSTFASIVFKDTNAAAKTTTMTVQAAVTLSPESNDNITGPIESLIAYEYPVTNFSREFGNIYKFVLNDTEKAVLLANGSQDAYVIISSVAADSDGFTQTCSLFELHKKPAENSINITDQSGTLWHSYGASGEVRHSDGSKMVIEPIIFDFIELMFPEEKFDIQNKTVGVTIAANYSEFIPGIPEPGVSPSPDIISISMDKTLVYIDNVGYNTFYTATDSNSDEKIIITFLNDSTALVTANLDFNGEMLYVTAMMRNLDDMDGAFFAGPWTAGYSDDIKINLVNSNQSVEARLINFGAVFRSFDINAGTAYLSSILVLSADNMLIPMAYEDLLFNVKEVKTGEEWNLTTSNGSNLTVKKIDMDTAEISGHIAYESEFLYNGIDLTSAKVHKAHQQNSGPGNVPDAGGQGLDFSTVTNGTWLTMNDSQSGGFAILSNNGSTSIYPAEYSDAEFHFNGENAIYGTSIMASKYYDNGQFVSGGPVFPFTLSASMPETKFTHLFGNFYKFENSVSDVDVNMKGIIILESETEAHMIISFTRGNGSAGTQNYGALRLYSVLHLQKNDNITPVDITNLNNSSWGIKLGGGSLIINPGAAGSREAILTTNSDLTGADKVQSFDVAIHDGNSTAGTAQFDVTARILTQTGEVIPYSLSNIPVNITRVAPNMFHAVPTSGQTRTEFIIIVLSGGTPSLLGDAILSANIETAYNNVPTVCSIAAGMGKK